MPADRVIVCDLIANMLNNMQSAGESGGRLNPSPSGSKRCFQTGLSVRAFGDAEQQAGDAYPRHELQRENGFARRAALSAVDRE